MLHALNTSARAPNGTVILSGLLVGHHLKKSVPIRTYINQSLNQYLSAIEVEVANIKEGEDEERTIHSGKPIRTSTHAHTK